MIKIDVEGFEYEVLKSIDVLLQLENVTSVVVEIDSEALARYGASRELVYQFMSARSFMARGHGQGSRHYDEVFTRIEVKMPIL